MGGGHGGPVLSPRSPSPQGHVSGVIMKGGDQAVVLWENAKFQQELGALLLQAEGTPGLAMEGACVNTCRKGKTASGIDDIRLSLADKHLPEVSQEGREALRRLDLDGNDELR